MADILLRKNDIILIQKKAKLQKKIRTVLKLIKVVISALKNVKSINITAEIIKENRESLILLKEYQLVSTDKDKQNLRNGLLLYNIRLIILKEQNNF